MRHFRIPLALLVTAAAMALSSAAVAAHNAGCVQTGTGEYVFVGSNKDSPIVPEHNPKQNDDGNLDLIEGPGDQYAARFAAEQGESAVEPPSPAKCEATGPRADN